MTMKRVQFRPGLSMAEFIDRYGSDDKCEAALIELRWPDGFACPACGCAHSSSFRREGRLRFRCAACRHRCSVIGGTLFEATELPLSRWFLAMNLPSRSENNVAALELMRRLGVCYKTARLIEHELMEVMRAREDSRLLDGRVEIDELLPGGQALGQQGRARFGETRWRSSLRCRPRPTAGRSSRRSIVRPEQFASS